MPTLFPRLLLLTLLALPACRIASTTDAAPDAGTTVPDAGEPPLDCSGAQRGAAQTIVVADKVHVDSSGTPNVSLTVPRACYSSIVVQLDVTTACDSAPPSGQNWPAPCDPFDRLAQVALSDPGTVPLFLLDAVTSFGGTTRWTQDITDYAPVLFGAHSIHIDVGTYADPSGSATGTASSHDVSVTVILTPGKPPHDVLKVIPLFRQGIDGSTGALTATITPPEGAGGGRLDFYTSGHGGNGSPPCDEFCKKQNRVTVDGASVFSGSPWVTCDDNCEHVPLSMGMISCGSESFDYICKQNPTSCPSSAVAPRANWCPSKKIRIFPLEWPGDALEGSHSIGLEVQNANGSWSIGLAAVFYR